MNNTGIIYLIQPVELVGVNRYKIGMSKSPTLDRVRNGYKKGARYLCIAEVKNPLELELRIKTDFKNRFKLIAGYETFEADEDKIKFEFNKLLQKHNIECPYCFEGNVKEEFKEVMDSEYCECSEGLKLELCFYTKDKYCHSCNNTGEHIRGGDCGWCGRTPKKEDHQVCYICEDTGHHKGEIGNYCYNDVGEKNGVTIYCPVGRLLAKEAERIERKFYCGSCENTGYFRKQGGIYCFDCEYGEILFKESKRVAKEKLKKLYENHFQDSDEYDRFDLIKEVKKLIVEENEERKKPIDLDSSWDEKTLEMIEYAKKKLKDLEKINIPKDKNDCLLCLNTGTRDKNFKSICGANQYKETCFAGVELFAKLQKIPGSWLHCK